MTEIERLEKNKRISQTKRETIERHSRMICKTLSLKIQKNKLNLAQKENLERLFLEAKWFKNSILNFLKENGNLKNFNLKSKTVIHKDKDMNDVEEDLKVLSSQNKITLFNEVKSNLKTLKTLKSKNNKVGAIRFFKEVNSVNYIQEGISYQIKGNKVKLQGLGKPFKVNGLKQLEDFSCYELANMMLIRKPTGLFLQLVVFIPKENIVKNGKTIGIDFGIRTSITTSEGDKYKVIVQESETLKNLQRKLGKQVRGSKRYNNTIYLIQKEYQKLTNKKDDVAKKVVAKLLENSTIVMQDEMLHNWKTKFKFGKVIQHSILGRVKTKLLKNENVVVLSSSLPTTKFCNKCGILNIVELKTKEYRCGCGLSEDRDIHAAKNMVWFYENKVGVGRTKFTQVEIQKLILDKLESKKLEAEVL